MYNCETKVCNPKNIHAEHLCALLDAPGALLTPTNRTTEHPELNSEL